jgi:hypothetical protein
MTPASISLQAPIITLNASGPLLINGCPVIVSGPLNTMVF